MGVAGKQHIMRGTLPHSIPWKFCIRIVAAKVRLKQNNDVPYSIHMQVWLRCIGTQFDDTGAGFKRYVGALHIARSGAIKMQPNERIANWRGGSTYGAHTGYYINLHFAVHYPYPGKPLIALGVTVPASRKTSERSRRR